MQSCKMNICTAVINFFIIQVVVIIPVFFAQPPNTALHQILFGWRVANTGIAFHLVDWSNIPGIFQKCYAFIFFGPLCCKEVAIKSAKVLLYKKRNIFIACNIHVAVIGTFNSSLSCKCVNDQVLVAIGIGHTQANGQHEFWRVKTNLYRPQKIIIQFLHFFFIYFNHKKFKIAFYVRVKYFLCIGRNFIAVLI